MHWSHHLKASCVITLQALWRGYCVRRASGRSSKEARARIAAAAEAAQAAPHKRIGVRAKQALEVLLASKQCSQVGAWMPCHLQRSS